MKLLNRLLDDFEGKFTSSTSYELNDVRSVMGSGRGLGCRVPAREHQHSQVTLECASENLRPLDAESDAIVLDGGEGGLGNASTLGELGLAKPLELTNDAHGLTDSDLDALLGGTKLTHYGLR